MGGGGGEVEEGDHLSSQESVDGLIFGGGGGGEVEEGDHLSSVGFQMQKSEIETENVK